MKLIFIVDKKLDANDFFKSKKFPVGTVRLYKGKKYQKLATGKWVPISEKTEKVSLNKVTIEDIKKLKKDDKFRNNFIKENQAFIVSTVNKMKSRLDSFQDTLQDANEGFINAINNFDISRNPKAFLSYTRKYVTGYIFKGLAKSMNEKSINISFEDEEGKKAELEEKIPDVRSGKDIEEIEFKETISKIGDAIKNDTAKNIFKYISQGKNKAEVSRLMKISKAAVTKSVKKYIKPVIEKYLLKSEIWNDFTNFINVFLNDERIDLTKSKQLEIGKKIETEHKGTYKFIEDYFNKHGKLPPEEEVYKMIAKDHLKEFKNYYSVLIKMEKKLEEGEKNV